MSSNTISSCLKGRVEYKVQNDRILLFFLSRVSDEHIDLILSPS